MIVGKARSAAAVIALASVAVSCGSFPRPTADLSRDVRQSAAPVIFAPPGGRDAQALALALAQQRITGRCMTARGLASRKRTVARAGRRRGLVKRRTQIKNEISAVLHRNLRGANPASDPFGKKGREWIAAQQLPIDERLTVDGCLRQLDFFGEELAEIDRLIAQQGAR